MGNLCCVLNCLCCDLWKCLFCIEDQHDCDYRSRYQPLPVTVSRKNYHHSETSHGNRLQPPSTPYIPKPSSSSSSKPLLSSSIATSPYSPKFPTSLSNLQQSSSVDPYSTFHKTPASSSKLPQSTSVFPSSLSVKPQTLPSNQPQSSSSPFPSPPIPSSKLPQSTFVFPSSLSVKPQTLPSNQPQSSSSPSPSHTIPSSKLPQSTFVFLSSLSVKPQTLPSNRPQSSFSPSPSPPIPSSTSSYKPSQASFEPILSASKPHPSVPKPLTSSSKPSALPSVPPISSPKPPPTSKQILSPAFSTIIDKKGKKNQVWVKKGFLPVSTNPNDGKKNYACVESDSLPVFMIPEDIKDLIKNDIVPKVLNQPLSPATYKHHFAALLYAEEFYFEKWPQFDLENVTLELQEAGIYKNKVVIYKNHEEKEDKTFVAFEIDTAREDRPFLLSRDLVYVRPSGTDDEQFQGHIYRIVRSNRVLVEFEDDFYDYHDSTQTYDVSFSFNRVCLKRAHQAVHTASEALFQNFLFPDFVSRKIIPTAPLQLSTCHKLYPSELSAVRHILSIQGSPPYIVSGPLCVAWTVFDRKVCGHSEEPSRTGVVVSEAVLQLWETKLDNRILICAPNNSCCDLLMRSMMKKIPEAEMFRANAAFREIDEVPDDILPSCLYNEHCFSCPPTEELRKFRVIFSTFMSSYRLHDKGLPTGHFSHIFLVNASSAIEPETLVALTNFADKNTTVIVTGQPGNASRWVRSEMARRKGLKISYFERLFESIPYRSLSPMFITELGS